MTASIYNFPSSVSSHARPSRTSKTGMPEDLRAARAAADAAKAVARKNPDAAFALIAEKLAADVTHLKAIYAQDAAERRFGHGTDEAWEAAEQSESACNAANEIDWRLANTPPTTLAGVAAVLRFANEIEDANNEWPETDKIGPDGWHYQLRATMAAALETIIRQSAVVQS
jgi:hypothetical protein